MLSDCICSCEGTGAEFSPSRFQTARRHVNVRAKKMGECRLFAVNNIDSLNARHVVGAQTYCTEDCLSTCNNACRHLLNFTRPDLQPHVLRIILVGPIYAFSASLDSETTSTVNMMNYGDEL
eukprot:s4186_g1.t1